MSLRSALAWALAGNACLLAASLRHNFVWGEGRHVLGVDLPVLLGIGEGIALVLFALLAGIPYARAARGGDADLPVGAVTRGGLVLLLAATAIPPFLSDDLYDNLARGRVEAVHGANPYSMPPAQFPEDPFTAEANWTSYGNPYGPISSAAQAGVCLIAGDNVWVGAYLFKALCALLHLGAAWCIYRAAARVRPSTAATAYFLYLWNPWILLETAGHAHNDALMVFALAASLVALADGRVAAATFRFGLAVLTKHSIALIGPLLMALAWRTRQLRAFAVGVAATAAVTALFVWRYFLESGAVEALVAQADHQRTSLQRLASMAVGDDHGSTITSVGYVLTVLVLLRCVPRVRDLPSFGRESVVLLLAFLLVGMPMFSPWYHLWWLPMVALWAWPGWTSVFFAAAICGPLSHLVYASTHTFGLAHELWTWAVGCVAVIAVAATSARASDAG